jgi:putative membrane protein
LNIEARFNPRIKDYIWVIGAGFLLITVIGIPLLPFWMLGLGQYYSRRYFEHLRCILNEQHLQFRKGVLFKVEKTIPLENIQDLTFIENPILNFFGLRIIKIETAGNSTPSGYYDMQLIGIEDSEQFKNQVLEQRNALKMLDRPSSFSSAIHSNEAIQLLRDIKNLLEMRLK